MNEAISFLLMLPLFVMAVVVHEVSHGVVALRFGDTTALTAGRLTLNPLRHIDLFGTILLPLMLALFHAPLFGWAKPVPVNAMRLRHPKRDIFWVGAAGPAANFSFAVVVSLLMRVVPLPDIGVVIGTSLILINLVLGIFNLLPIPPLDGSRILAGVLPARFLPFLMRMERWGFLILFALLYLGVIDRILWPLVAWCAKALGV